MKNKSIRSLVYIYFLSLFIIIASNPTPAQIVVIDAGHGYYNDCSNGDGRTTTEINTNWAVSMKLKDVIQTNTNWSVYLTRPENGCGSWISVGTRTLMSNNWNADLFLSIHCNAGGGTGTETFWCELNDPNVYPDIDFAEDVQYYMYTYGEWVNRRVVEDLTYLPNHLGVLSQSNATGCLNEIGFVDNTSDAAKLLDDNWRDVFAYAYYLAISYAPTGIEDYIWVYADHPEIPFNVNQIYYQAVHANFVDEYPYGDYIVQWGNWQVKALSTCGEILVYESPNNGTSYINIPPLPNYEWIRDGNNNVVAKVITSGVDNNGYYHQNFADIKIGNVPNAFITSGELTSDTYWCGDLTITGDITVPRDVTLTILPGADITFANNSSLIVDGSLSANGISYSQINFNFISPDYEYENGIKINQGGTANITYSVIDNAYIGITINETNADINNCEISNCGRGIYLYRTNYANEDSWLMDNKISGCSYYGISMYQSSPYIIGNELHDNGMALFCDQYSSPYLGYAETYGNNYIHNNSIGLFANFSSNPFLGRTGCIAFGGANSFVNQSSYHIQALNYCEILAENNWWYPLTAGKFYSYNSNIDYEPYLEEQPFNNMNNIKNSPEESVFDSKFAQRGFDSKVATEEKELGFQNDWCIKWKLLYARNLIEVKKYKQAQKICKDVIEEYPDSALTHYAVDLLWQASRRGDNDSLKGFFKKLSNKKAKKKLYASAEKILAGFERNLRIENLDKIISKYSGEPVLEAVMFDKFIYYFNEQKNKQLARYMSAQLDSLFPGSHSAEEAHRFLGDTQPGGNMLSKANLGAENTVVIGADNLPKEYELRGNYPNPFNPSTTISYGLPEESKVQITVYDILGTRVTELVNENQSAGYYNVAFNARNLASGIYIYRFTAVKPDGKYFERVSKLMLMK